MRRLLLLAFIACAPCGMVHAEDRGSAADAQSMLDKAVDHYHAVGRDKAFVDFSDKGGPFFYRDLYVYCDRDGSPPVLSFHPIAKTLVNKTLETVVDSNGRQFGIIMLREALKNGKSSIDYAWPDPVTKKIVPKTTLAAKVSDDEACAVGFYH